MGIIKQVKNFINGKMNLDSNSHLLTDSEFREIWNSMIGVSGGQNVENLTQMLGTTNAFDLPINSDFSLPLGDFTCVGAVDDIRRRCIVYFLCDTSGNDFHRIIRLFVDNYKLETVFGFAGVLNLQIQPSDKKLSANIVEDLLYWTDGYEGEPFVDYNPPRKINMVKATAYTNQWVSTRAYYKGQVVGYGGKSYRCIADGGIGVSPVVAPAGSNVSPYWELANITHYDLGTATAQWFQILDAIKYPPRAKPNVFYSTDANVHTNRVQGKLFQFKYQYVYDDNGKSVWSDISDIPYPDQVELLNGTFDNTYTSDNLISVGINTGSREVKSINIAFRELNTGVWKLVHRIYKYDQDGGELVGSSINYPYNFYNDEVGEAIDQLDSNRSFDYVPQIAECQDVIEKTRVAYANYKADFDNVNIDVQLGLLQDHVIKTLGQTCIFEDDAPVNHTKTYPMYALGIDWNDGSNHTNYPQSPQRYSCLVADFVNVGVSVGYTYALSVSAQHSVPNTTDPVPYQYVNSADPAVADYPDEFVGDYTVATAVVTATPEDTLQSIINKLCSQFRSFGKNSEYSLIAFVKSDFDIFRNDTWGVWTEQGDLYGAYRLNNDSEIGFVLQFGGAQGVDMDNCIVNLIISKNEKYSTFLSGDTKQFGLVYRDRGKRCGFVNTSTDASIYVPFQNENGSGEKIWRNRITWEINHTPPIEADTYRWALAYNPYYHVYAPLIDIDDSPSVYTADQSAQSNIAGLTGYYIGLSVLSNFYVTKDNFQNFNIETYTWQKGDRVRFVFKSSQIINPTLQTTTFNGLNYLDFEIIASIPTSNDYLVADDGTTKILNQDGNWVRNNAGYMLIIPKFDYNTEFGANNQDMSTFLPENQVIVQIYRPNQRQETVVYYEFGECLDILNPHTANRVHQGGQYTDHSIVLYQHDQTSSVPAKGVFVNGDAYVVKRFMCNDQFSSVFPCESNSYSDWFDSNAVSIGLPHLQNESAKRTEYEDYVIFGGRYITDTNTNDLSKFDASNAIPVGAEYGAIKYIKKIGFTLKILQKSKPQSLYIGRSGITQPSAQSTEILSATKDVLGTLITPESNYGTVHPNSAVVFEGSLFYYDALSGDIIRDAGNGQQSISKSYKIDSWIREKSRLFQDSGFENVKVFATYDQSNDVMYMSFEDTVTPANSFTVGFHNGDTQDTQGFTSFHEWNTDYFATLKQFWSGWRDGKLWVHNLGTRNNIYGSQYYSSVKTVFNKNPNVKKVAQAVAVRSNKLWSCPNQGDIYVPPDDSYPRGQSSLIKSGAFEQKEGTFWSAVGKNMITHQIAPTNADFVEGDNIRGEFVETTFRNTDTDETKLFTLEMTFTDSAPN